MIYILDSSAVYAHMKGSEAMVDRLASRLRIGAEQHAGRAQPYAAATVTTSASRIAGRAGSTGSIGDTP